MSSKFFHVANRSSFERLSDTFLLGFSTYILSQLSIVKEIPSAFLTGKILSLISTVQPYLYNNTEIETIKIKRICSTYHFVSRMKSKTTPCKNKENKTVFFQKHPPILPQESTTSRRPSDHDAASDQSRYRAVRPRARDAARRRP